MLMLFIVPELFCITRFKAAPCCSVQISLITFTCGEKLIMVKDSRNLIPEVITALLKWQNLSCDIMVC